MEQEYIPAEKDKKKLAIELLNRRQFAVAQSMVWWGLLRSAYYLSQPNRNVFLTQQSPGDMKNFDVYDLTLVLATRTFVNKMQNALVPQNINWVQFEPGNEVQRQIKAEQIPKEEVEKLDQALQRETDLFFSYLRDSNFDTVINEAFYDLAVGTATLQCNETDDDDQPFVFTSVPQDKIAFEEGAYGSIDSVFRDYLDMRLSVAMAMWGEDLKLPSNFRRNNKSDEESVISLYECSYYDRATKKYRTYLVESTTSEIVYEKEDDSWEFINFRWYKLPGEIRGRGPVIDAYPGAATINLAFRDELAASELRSHPIYMGFDDGVFNPYTFQLRPNTIMPVEAPGDSKMWPLAPLPASGDITYSAIVINDIREQINKLMFSSPLGPVQETPPLTATEVAIRQNEMIEDAAASFARLQRELFVPLIKRVIFILKKKGKMSDIKVGDKIIGLKFRTPLSLGKGQIDVNQFLQYFQSLAGVVGPNLAMGMTKIAQLPGYMAKNMNVDLSLIQDEKTITKAITDFAQAANAALGDETQ